MSKISQKQLFADFLQKDCSYQFQKIHRKISVPESVFDEVAFNKLY